ncbi:glycosyltransferase [Candidatus Daviesbacteria bacterium]|nr:glycosyltransferase [Candidatus Daviesbacteria bacterium]
MKVALVHDDLIQWGGAERVLSVLSEIFPEAPIYTSCFDESNIHLSNNFSNKKIITSFIQKIPGFKTLYKSLLPLYPIAFEQFDFSEYDLVISHTTRFAKSVLTKPKTTHVSYCHTPPRFLWRFSKQPQNKLLTYLLSYFRIYDQISSSRVDYFIAGSENAKQRIQKIYKQNSLVCFPFVDDKFFNNSQNFDGGYYLMISRLNFYKRVDLAIQVFNNLKKPLKIIGTGPELSNLSKLAKGDVEFLGNASDNLLINFISGAKALIITSEEDFGLTALEAQALGKPVIGFREGGVLETVIENITGVFFDEQTEESLKKTIELFERKKFNREDCINNAKNFSKDKFKQRFLKSIKNIKD